MAVKAVNNTAGPNGLVLPLFTELTLRISKLDPCPVYYGPSSYNTEGNSRSSQLWAKNC